MLRLILILALLYILFRLVRSALAPSWRSFRSNLFSKGAENVSRVRDGSVIDEMRPCAQCATFHPSRQSYRKKELYFCNRQCHEAYQSAEKRKKA